MMTTEAGETDPRTVPTSAEDGPGGFGLIARGAAAAIRGYQGARSGRPTGCRYLPTCSEYARTALLEHGALRGTMLGIRRLSRCGPWGGHGVDPVPDRRS